MTSSRRSGLRPRSASRMPADSSWNTPNVFASVSSAYALASSRGSASTSMVRPRDSLMSLAAFERARDVPELRHRRVALRHLGERRRLLIGVVQRDVEGEPGDQLGDAVHVG